MSRTDDFKRMAYDHDRESSKYEQQCYIDGAEDGYEYAVEKACEWLTKYVVHYRPFDKQIINDFKREMEQ